METKKEEKKFSKQRIELSEELFDDDATEKPAACVRYAMAMVSSELFKMKGTPTKDNKIHVKGGHFRGSRYLWTALMVFGNRHPSMKFGNESIFLHGFEFFPQNELDSGAFSKESLYETVFKHHLTEDMLVVTEFPRAFECIPINAGLTIEEQEIFVIEQKDRKMRGSKGQEYPISNENWLRLEIEKLNYRTFDEVRDFFSTLPRHKQIIYLKGDFEVGQFTSSHVAKALAYLPKHVNKIVFEVQYCYSSSLELKGRFPRRFSWLHFSRLLSLDNIHTKKIGNSLKDYIISLPPSVNSVAFHFNNDPIIYFGYSDEALCLELNDILKALKPSVNYLSIKNFLMKKKDLYLNIPFEVQVQSLVVDGSHVDVSSLSALTELGLPNNILDWLILSSNSVKNKHLKLLDLSYNDYLPDLGLIASTVKALRLCGSQLAVLSFEGLIEVLSKVTTTLDELDIGENGLTERFGDSQLATILGALPKSLVALRICEKGFSPYGLFFMSQYLPNNIKILSFKDSDLLSISIKDFVANLAHLPETVEGLDFSSNNLSRIAVAELIYLLSNLPRHIRILKLNDNSLACLEITDLRAILSALSPFVEELDVSNNGLDRLTYTQMCKIQTFFPQTVKRLITGSSEFTLLNDGSLVPYKNLSQVGLFKPQKQFNHQWESFSLHLIMNKIIQVSGFNSDVFSYLLSYVYINVSRAEIERISELSCSFPAIISSVPPKQISSADQKQCIYAVSQRIKKLKDHSFLDLSRCGLNRLVKKKYQEKFFAAMRDINTPITTLNLRGNGFLHDEQSKNVFIALMGQLDETINCLDLSDNGFEHRGVEDLEELFEYLPAKVQMVRLGHGEPMSRETHIEKHDWPESYQELIKDSGRIKQIRNVLDDYSKGDSALMRFCYIRWRLSHTDVVPRIVYLIDKKLITNPEDLCYELEQIPLKNEEGSLARRICFLQGELKKENYKARSRADEDNEIELQSLGYK
ncbi:MAG: DUF5617 domain-containing protein [Tatlockia sp.]|nr:DUF5617 domain-containing protein [Tatlockia sp.]